MKYSIDHLYHYYNKDNKLVDRYLVNFINEEGLLKVVELEITEDTMNTIMIIEEESDSLNKDDRKLLYYILDRWAIDNLI